MAGLGNHLSFENREYDSRTGRFNINDPISSEYPWQSPYTYYRNSPISTIDYLGLGDYYTADGRHLGSDGKTKTIGKGKNARQVPDDKAYIADGRNADGTFNNPIELKISNSVLNQLANTTAQESSGDKLESFAIASTILNLANYKNKSIERTLSTEGIYGFGNGGNSTAYGNNRHYGMAAALNAVIGGTDYSNGALRWDGFDFAEKGADHVKARYDGLFISEKYLNLFQSAWSRYKPKNPISAGVNPATTGPNKGMVLYRSTAEYGKTIFWGRNNQNFNFNFGLPDINGFNSDQPCVTLPKAYPNKNFHGTY